MRAVIASPAGAMLADVPLPSAGPEDVLVQVRASALNRLDLSMQKGAVNVDGPGVPLGLEWAGDVVEVGPGVTRWQVGDRVMSGSGRALADYATAYEGHVYPVPSNLTYVEAVGLPVALQTMHDAIATNGQLRSGETVLIQGASTAVGLMGVQVAKLLGARLVIGSSTSPERRARLSEFGADLVIDSQSPGWVDQVLEATGGEGVDLLIDQLAGPMINPNMRATRILGRIVNVGRLGGMHGEFDFDLHALRRITYIGVTFRTRSAREVQTINELTTRDLWPALTAGQLRLPVDSVLPLEDFAAALDRMATNQHFGKIVLTNAPVAA